MDSFTTKSQDIILNSESTTSKAAQQFDSKLEIPFSQYSNINKHTFTEEFFGIESPDNQIIEDYITQQITNRKLTDSLDSYRQIIEELYNKIGVEKNEIVQSKFQKIIKFINMVSKVRTPEEKKEVLLERAEKQRKEREEKLRIFNENNLKKEIELLEKTEQERKTMAEQIKKLEEEKQIILERNKAKRETKKKINSFKKEYSLVV
jgi:hypothetical protein